MNQITARVVAKNEIAPGIFRLALFAPAVAREAKPGQFVHIKCGDNQANILRRPFSVHQIVGAETVELLVKVVGEGTKWLTAREPKDPVDLIGPLGRGFEVKENLSRALIVGGGMGVAPLIFLAAVLSRQKVKVYTAMGASSRAQLLDFMDLKRITRKIVVATDDGSQGQKGPVTDVLAKEIEEDEPEQIFACGPMAMVRSTAGIARRFGIPCQVSLEARMACGVGACLGCTVGAKDGYLKVCSDGPVFTAEELGW